MDTLIYKLDERPPVGRSLLYALQWLLIVLPLITVSANLMASFLSMPPDQASALFQRMLFVVGITTAAQCAWGHRYPLIDGPSAALLLSVAALSSEGLAVVEGGMLAGGALLFILGGAGLVGKMRWMFTDRVVGVVLLLIALTFLPYLYPMVTGIKPESPNGSLATVGVTVTVATVIILLSYWVGGFLRNMSILVGIVFGYILMLAMGEVNMLAVRETSWLALPRPFIGELPRFTAAGALSFLLAYIAVLINGLGSFMSVAEVVGDEDLDRRIERGVTFTGLSGVLSAATGSLGTVSYAQSPGVILVTRVGSRFPVMLCALMLIALAFFQKIAAFLSTIPDAVVGAALLVTLASMVGLGISLAVGDGKDMGVREYLVLGLPVLMGTTASMLPDTFLGLFPAILQGLLGNGLIVGIVVVLALEHVVLRKKSG